MKRIIIPALLVTAAAGLQSCMSPEPIGGIYADTTTPMAVASGNTATKVGKSESISYFTLYSTGDSSIEAAKKNGGIKTISHVDAHTKNYCGIKTIYTTIVYGN